MAFYGDNYRYIILTIGFLCLASVCSNYIIINFTFICMKEDTSETRIVDNVTRGIYDYTANEKKWIMWFVAAGTIIGTVPTNYLVVRFGAKWPFLIAGILSAVSTMLIPIAAAYRFDVLLGLRFLQGLAYSTDFAAIGIITVRWAPLQDTATFIAVLTCFTGASSMITNSATGLICQSYGWKYAYYIHSIVGLGLFFLWFLTYDNNPATTGKLSDKERSTIQRNKSCAHLEKNPEIPYLKLATSPVILVVWLNAFFEMSAIIMFATYMPIYFHQVLGFGVTKTGFYVGLVLGVNIPLRIVGARCSDMITSVPEIWKIRFFNTISVGISGLLLSAIGFFEKEHREICFIVTLTCMMCTSVNCGGFYKSAVLHARQFSHVVIAAIQFTKCLALFVAPALVAFFVTDEMNRVQWIPVFMTLGVAMFLANIISLFVFTTEPAEWTEDKKIVEMDQFENLTPHSKFSNYRNPTVGR